MSSTSPNAISTSSVIIRRLTSEDEIAASQSLRYQVWRDEGIGLEAAPSQKIADAHDEHAFHWGAFDGPMMVGSARMCIHDDIASAPDGYMFSGLDIPTPIASMNKLVVLKRYRGAGLGKQLDTIRIEAARTAGAKAVIVAPVELRLRPNALSSLGFLMTGRNSLAGWSTSVPITATYLIFPEVLQDGEQLIFAS